MAQQLNSMSSSSTTVSPPSDKRTRELPNLSECFSCLTRINHTSNPLERLQPLQSIWRIVLLCKKCIKSVSSAQLCTYCLKSVDDNDCNFVTCNLCNCRIHSQCVSSYKDSPPWRYLEGEFSVCIDCWVPEALKKSVTVVVKGIDDVEGGMVKSWGRNTLGWFKRREGVLDDKELAARFRRIFSECPRLERRDFCLDSWDLNIWKLKTYQRSRLGRECSQEEIMSSRSFENGVRADGNDVGLLTYKRDKKRKVFLIDDDGGTTCSTDASDAVLCVDVDQDRFGESFAVYKRSKFRGKGQVNGAIYESGKCCVCDSHECSCKTGQPDDEKDVTRLVVECEANGISPDRGGDADQDRYHLKYLRRVANTNSRGTDQDRYHLKYLRRVANTNSRGTDQDRYLVGSPVDGDRDILEAFTRVECEANGISPDRGGNADQDRYHLKYLRKVANTNSRGTDQDRYLVGSPVDGDRDILESFTLVDAGIAADRFVENLAVYKRSRFRSNGQVNGTLPVECRLCDDRDRDCTCETEHRQLDGEKDTTKFIDECNKEQNGSFNTAQDRYKLKYFKKVATTKPYSSRLLSSSLGCENKSSESAFSNSESDSFSKCDDELRLLKESGDAGVDMYSFKYVKRVKGAESGSNAEMKLHSEFIQPKSEASNTGLIAHHNAASETMSKLNTLGHL